MSTEEARVRAATALRDLNHAFATHDPDDATLAALEAFARDRAAALDPTPIRDRYTLMHTDGRAGFEDRAVAGRSNPTSIEFDLEYEGETAVVRFMFRRAFEGAPGRAHGGMVAAAFDDVTGFVIGLLREPAFTGTLSVRYNAPVPVEEPLVMRSWLRGREGRKLFIDAECHAGDRQVATCEAIYVTVDPSYFGNLLEPR